MPNLTEVKGAHHPRQEGPGWADAREELLDAYLQTLASGTAPSLEEITLPVIAWLAGLTSVADWIGSIQEWFPLGERADSLLGHYKEALKLAAATLNAIGWPEFRPLLASEADTGHLPRASSSVPRKRSRSVRCSVQETGSWARPKARPL